MITLVLKISEQELLSFLVDEFKSAREQNIAAEELCGKDNNLAVAQGKKAQFIRELYFKLTGEQL